MSAENGASGATGWIASSNRIPEGAAGDVLSFNNESSATNKDGAIDNYILVRDLSSAVELLAYQRESCPRLRHQVFSLMLTGASAFDVPLFW